MADRYPGGVISKTPPTITAPVDGEGGSASGMWTLDTVLEYEKAGAWPKPILPRELYAWGYNSSGILGQNNTIDRSSPVQIGASINWSKVSGGTDHAIATKLDGTMWSWGRNDEGQLGQNNLIYTSSPVQVGSLTNWAQVSAGGLNSFAIKTDNTLWAWGNNNGGASIGDNTSIDKSSPVQIGALSNWAQVSAGLTTNNGAVAVKTDGTLWSWGYNYRGQLGDGTTVSKSSPIQVGALTNWKSANMVGLWVAAVKTDGTLWSWGTNLRGNLGLNNTVYYSSPQQVGSLTTWAAAQPGSGHCLAVKTDGTLWAWGFNTSGQVGDSTNTSRSSPVQVGSLTDWSVELDATYISSFAVKTDGTLWFWGSGAGGRSGLNSTTNQNSPVQVGSLTNWSVLGVGRNSALAITKG